MMNWFEKQWDKIEAWWQSGKVEKIRHMIEDMVRDIMKEAKDIIIQNILECSKKDAKLIYELAIKAIKDAKAEGKSGLDALAYAKDKLMEYIKENIDKLDDQMISEIKGDTAWLTIVQNVFEKLKKYSQI